MSKKMVTTWGRTKTRIQVEYKVHCTGITEEAKVDKNLKEKKSEEAGHVSPVLPSPSVVLEDCCCSPSEGAAVGATGGWD